MSDGERVIGIDNHVYYGICTSAAREPEKVVVIQNPTLILEDETYELDLNEGDQLNVSFSQRNEASNPQLTLKIKEAGSQELIDIGTNINSGRVVIDGQTGPSLVDYWESGDVISFTYVINVSGNTGYWVINNFGVASENRFGTVKLADSEDEVDESDERLAASIPKIKSLILSDINKLGLSIDRSTWVLQLTYDGDPLSSGEELDKQTIPQRTSGLLNDGPDPNVSNAAYIYKVGSTINEGNTALNIGTVNATTLNGSLATSYLTGGIDASKTTSGVFAVARIPDLSANKITSGVFPAARIPALSSLSGNLSTARIDGLDAYVKNRRRNFFIKTHTCYLFVSPNDEMTAYSGMNVVIDSKYSAHMNISVAGYAPLGIVGHYFSKWGEHVMAKKPTFQDCYLSGSNVYFAVQNYGNSIGGVAVSIQILYGQN